MHERINIMRFILDAIENSWFGSKLVTTITFTCWYLEQVILNCHVRKETFPSSSSSCCPHVGYSHPSSPACHFPNEISSLNIVLSAQTHLKSFPVILRWFVLWQRNNEKMTWKPRFPSLPWKFPLSDLIGAFVSNKCLRHFSGVNYQHNYLNAHLIF